MQLTRTGSRVRLHVSRGMSVKALCCCSHTELGERPRHTRLSHAHDGEITPLRRDTMILRRESQRVCDPYKCISPDSHCECRNTFPDVDRKGEVRRDQQAVTVDRDVVSNMIKLDVSFALELRHSTHQRPYPHRDGRHDIDTIEDVLSQLLLRIRSRLPFCAQDEIVKMIDDEIKLDGRFSEVQVYVHQVGKATEYIRVSDRRGPRVDFSSLLISSLGIPVDRPFELIDAWISTRRIALKAESVNVYRPARGVVKYYFTGDTVRLRLDEVQSIITEEPLVLPDLEYYPL